MQTSPSSALIKYPSRDTGKLKESGIERGCTQGEKDGKFKAYGKNNVEKGYWRLRRCHCTNGNAAVPLGACQ